MQVSQIAAIADAAGNIVEPAGIRACYMLNGYQIEETRQPAANGNVKRTLRNATTGEVTVETVSPDQLQPL